MRQTSTSLSRLDMRRILEAAAAAARGGRRREINGAIVLAAIVGDGKSAAAQVLSALGLTFEGAIRALQSKPAPAAEQRAATGARRRGDTRRRARARAIADGRGAAPAADERRERATRSRRPSRSRCRSSEARAMPPPAYEPEPRSPSRIRAERLTGAPITDAVRTGTIVRARRRSRRSSRHRRPEPDRYHEAEPQYEPAFEPQPSFERSLRAPRAAADAGLGTVSAARCRCPIRTTAGHRHRRHRQRRRIALRSTASRRPRRPHCRRMPAPARPRRARVRRPWRRGRTSACVRPGAGAPRRHGGERFGVHCRRRAQARAAPGARTVSPRTEIGQLVENIPRSMRVAVPALIEVRIARADVQALAEGLQGGGAAYQHEVTVTKAMSVRLRAPDGGFFIETASPETQWIEKAMLLSSEDFASWRWHVTPREQGAAAAAVDHLGAHRERRRPGGRDGAARSGDHGARAHQLRARSAARWVGWGAAAVVGGLLAKFGEGAFDALGRMLIAG